MTLYWQARPVKTSNSLDFDFDYNCFWKNELREIIFKDV